MQTLCSKVVLTLSFFKRNLPTKSTIFQSKAYTPCTALECASCCWNSLPKYHAEKQQDVQRWAARVYFTTLTTAARLKRIRLRSSSWEAKMQKSVLFSSHAIKGVNTDISTYSQLLIWSNKYETPQAAVHHRPHPPWYKMTQQFLRHPYDLEQAKYWWSAAAHSWSASLACFFVQDVAQF